MTKRHEAIAAIVFLLICAAIFAYFVPRHAAAPKLDPITHQTIPIVEQESGTKEMSVSYTAKGFEPSDVRIAAGSTVRFTNTTDSALHIVAAGDAMYPKEGDACGKTSFDSCATLKKGETWTFTFTKQGNWMYWNEADQSATGVVRVI